MGLTTSGDLVSQGSSHAISTQFSRLDGRRGTGDIAVLAHTHSRRSRPQADGHRHDRVARITRTPGTWPSGSCRLPDRTGTGIGRRSTSCRLTSIRFPKNDLSRQRAEEFGFTIYPTIAEALRCGGDKLAVDAVLIIGEHGNYPINELGQKKYPRYEFFKQVADVFRQGRPSRPGLQRQAPVVEMGLGQGDGRHVARAEVPVPGRLVAAGDVADAGDRPAVRGRGRGDDVRRASAASTATTSTPWKSSSAWPNGGAAARRGVAAVQALRGDAVWKAHAGRGRGRRAAGTRALFEACLCRSQTLAQPEPTFSHRYPTPTQIRAWVKDPVAYRFEYADGLKATMLLMNGLVRRLHVRRPAQGRRPSRSRRCSTCRRPRTSTYSAALMSKAEEMFLTGKAPVSRSSGRC